MLSTLDALLLYLIVQGLRSGYEVRRLFQTTPLQRFSDSPGAIYPALARLERGGLLSSRAETTGRRRRAYAPTAAGETALDAWIEGPPDLAAALRRPDEMDIRFVITANRAGWARARAFLAERERAEAENLARLEAHASAPEGAAMDRAARGALELGVALTATRLTWIRTMLKRPTNEGGH